jgi:type I restriction enzyme M protein
VLFLQKKTQEQIDNEEKSGQMSDYNIFTAVIDKIGHDKRGNPLFKRDEQGNEILAPENTGAQMSKKKIEDDQTPDVPVIFTKWKQNEGIGW